MSEAERLLNQVRAFMSNRADAAEQRSIGGSRTFTVRGNMCCGVGPKGLMVRVGPEQYAAALAEPHVRALAMGSKKPVGYVMLESQALEDDGAFDQWLTRALRFVLTLPPKPAKPPRTRATS